MNTFLNPRGFKIRDAYLRVPCFLTFTLKILNFINMSVFYIKKAFPIITNANGYNRNNRKLKYSSN